MFKQQVLGVINLSLPIIVLFYVYPHLFLSFTVRFVCALLWGAYICYLNWKQLKNLMNSLKYVPTGDKKDLFNNAIKECNLNPNDFNVRYAYTNESIALAAGNTLVIDPIIWRDIDNDSEATKVKDIFELHIKHTLSDAQKDRLIAFHKTLNAAAQRFIFKHELGHIFYNYSYKKLVVIFMIGALTTYTGITAAVIALQVNGIIVLFLGLFVGGMSDILFTYISNALWKVYEEKKADKFAVQYSSYEDIQAAAHFFEKHQEIIDATTKQEKTLLRFIPSIFLSGHQNGKSRSKFILQLATKKQVILQ